MTHTPNKYGMVFMLAVCLAVLMCGCSGVDPEKRLYPLVMSVDYKNSQYLVSYGMASLPEATGQDKPQEGEDVTGVSLSGRKIGRASCRERVGQYV